MKARCYAAGVRAYLLALLPLTGSACNSTHNPVTAPGTVIIDWDNTKATRIGVKTATVGPHTPKDFTVEVHRGDGAPPFSYDLHLELAPVDYEEGGRPAHHTAAVVIKLTVKDNTGWDLSGGCDSGPDYQFGPVDSQGRMEAPLAMIQNCATHEHREGGRVFRSSWAVGTFFQILGDGKVEASPPGDVTITPK